MWTLAPFLAAFRAFRNTSLLASEHQPQPDLHLSWCIGVCGLQESRGQSVVCREVIESNSLIDLYEISGAVQEAVAKLAVSFFGGELA